MIVKTVINLIKLQFIIPYLNTVTSNELAA